MGVAPFSYVLPLRWSGEGDDPGDMAIYLARLARICDDVIVVDGSCAERFAAHRRSWFRHVRHVAPDPRQRWLMGKVDGVLTGVQLARHDRVVVADDDVRYDAESLTRAVSLLDSHDLVRPQNYFDPAPWHALWDTGRILLNRSLGADFPGTFALRRSKLLACGGYDGDVLFENLELIRTMRAAGASVASPLDLYVRRSPPSARHFWGQRTRQAYDDFALPVRMAIWLSVLPLLGLALRARRGRPVAGAAAVCVALAERGRRRAGGRRVFPPVASVLAPLWVLERGVCSWLAVLQRLRFGGVRYGDSVIRVAAHSERELRLGAESRPSTGSRSIGQLMHRAPPRPRASSEPEKVSTSE